MTIKDAFEEIMQYSHYWNWVSDSQVTKEIYETYPNLCSVLSPFAYSYLEELIRSTTSEHGKKVFDDNWNPIISRKVGMKLKSLTIKRI